MPIINTVLGGKKPTGIYIATGAVSNYDAYANDKRYITIGQGSASNPTDTTARDSTDTDLFGTVLTVQAAVTPTVVAGWVDSGVAGTIKIKGTVPTQTKAAVGAGTVTPDSGKLLSSVTVASGSASVADATKASTSTSLDGTTLTVQASVSPTVTAGWVDSGAAGTIKITGTVPTQSKAASGAGTVLPDTGKLLSSVTVAAGSVSVTDATLASTSTSLSGTVLTVQASVAPTVSAGWVSSGSAGTIKITGTVPTEVKSAAGAGDVTPGAGKLLSKVTVDAGSAAVTSATYSSVTPTISGTSYTASVDVTPTVAAGWVDNGTSGTITLTGTVPTQSKSATGAGTVTPDSGKLLSSVAVSAGSAVITSKAVSANTLAGSWSSANNRYEVLQAGQTISVAGSCTPGWVSTVSSGTITVNAPAAHTIDRASITQTSAASYTSSGVLASGQYINIAPGYNPVGTTWQAPTGTTIQGDATPANVLAGKTFMSASAASVQTGTMVNNGSWSYDLLQNNSPVFIPEGYHDGFGVVTARIAAGTITLNTSGGASSGTIEAGQQIKIGTGYYDSDLYYTAASATPSEEYIIVGTDSLEFGPYVRNTSLDHTLGGLFEGYGWTATANPIISGGTTYTDIYTDSAPPAINGSIYDEGGSSIDYDYSSVVVKSYQPSVVWSDWTALSSSEIGLNFGYLYAKILSSMGQDRTNDLFYAKATAQDSARGWSLYYGGISNPSSAEWATVNAWHYMTGSINYLSAANPAEIAFTGNYNVINGITICTSVYGPSEVTQSSLDSSSTKKVGIYPTNATALGFVMQIYEDSDGVHYRTRGI